MLFYSPQAPAPHFFLQYLGEQGLLTNSAEMADALVLPFMYEVIHDYKPEKLARLGLGMEDLPALRRTANELDELSVRLAKPLIIFFYRDPTIPLPFKNAWIFRTSGFASLARKGEWGMPAFIGRKPANTSWETRKKQAIPAVSFRGKAAPENYPFSIRLREKANRLLAKMGSGYRLKNYQPEGYLLRRRAVLSCKRAGGRLIADLHINPRDASQDDYLKSFRDSDYIICAAGYGNYSYRFYETLREGRIPVYLDTDELLPCADVIKWKELMVWVPAAEVDRTAEYILDFHSSIHPDEFVQRQHKLRELYEKYLTTQGFSRYLVNDFLPQMSPPPAYPLLGGVPPAKR